MQQRTLYTMFKETVSRHGADPAVRFKIGKETEYTTLTYQEFSGKVVKFRRGLDALGLRKGDRIALISHENRVEWAIADLAAQSLGLITVPIYGSLPASQVAYYMRDSSAKAIVISDHKQLAKIQEVRAELPELEFVIAMEGDQEKLADASALAFEEVVRRGESSGRSESELDAISASIDPDATATFIYTSGTTGDPKAAMLTHMNLLHTPDAVVAEPILTLGPGDVLLSFLPLSHITERVGGHYLPLRTGACIVYSQGLFSFGNELTTTVQPTLVLCVPRLWENIYEKFRDSLPKMEEKQRKGIEWALDLGRQVTKYHSEGRGVNPILAVQHALAEKTVLCKIREKVTGGKLRFCVSGGAPLDPETAIFFLSIGIQMLEGYGLSETGILAVNRPHHQRVGTVGKLLMEAEVRIADDGEILARGPMRMQGYFNKPEATAEALDSEGWFHTGDIGELSTDGFLKITDRKKDLIVLTNGKKVAPQPIEALLKHSPYIAEAVLLGDKQSTVMALLVPAFDKLKAWAKEQSLPNLEDEVLVANPDVLKLFKSEIERCAPNLADFEKIKRFKLIANSFSVDGGELTPTLKVKRKFVIQKYAEVIASMTR